MSNKPFYEQNGGNLSKSPPDYLGKTAKDAWKRIVPFLLSTGRVDRIDTTLVEQYCTTYETYRQAYEDVKKNGSVIAPPPEPLISPTGEQVGEKYIIKAAGYTPVLYGYKNFLINHLGYNGLLNISNQYPLWLAEYPDYAVRRYPNYNFFPSFNNVCIFQFTSTYVWGGLDGDVDLTGITDNGYTKNTQPAPKPAQQPQKNTQNTSSTTWRDALGDTWHSERGTFTAGTWINLRWGARTSSSRIATIAPGAEIKYDAWSNHGGYIWIRQPRANGGYAYLAVRNAWTHEPFGYFK